MAGIEREAVFQKLHSQIGNTNLIEINSIHIPNGNRIFVKCEYENPSGSHYDRVYWSLFFKKEISDKIIQAGITNILENSSGCAGASCSYIGANLGYSVTIIVPDNLPKAKKELIKFYGGQLIETSGDTYLYGTTQKLRKLLSENKTKDTKYYCLNHSQEDISITSMSSCGREVIESMNTRGSEIDIFVSAAGNGTSLVGIGKELKKQWGTKIIAVDPSAAPVATSMQSGAPFTPKPHELFGIGAWGIDFPFLHTDLIDDIVIIEDEQWQTAEMTLTSIEGLAVGHTTSACFHVAMQQCELSANKNYLIIAYDKLENYL